MHYSVKMLDKTVRISLTKSAIKAMAAINYSLCVEMELYFSCLIRKRVLFEPAGNIDTASRVDDHLYVRFRPVMTQTCSMDDSPDSPPVTDFPIADASAFVPKWLKIDYKKGNWLGEFGY